MIKKLRIKFIAVNMIIVTVMLVVIFGMIYYFTQNNLEEKSIDMMRTFLMAPVTGAQPQETEEVVRLPYFSLQVGIDGELIAVGGGYYDLTDTEFLKKLADIAFESQREYGVIEEYNLRFLKGEMPMNRGLVFADISSEKETLRNLVKTCILIGGASFLVFLGISILLSRWAVKPVEQAWKMQRQFVADASHELKTPLTVIMTNAELIETGGDQESDKRYASNISLMSNRMKGLVSQMLDLARADNMNSRLVSENVDLSESVNNAIMPFEPIFFEEGKTLEFDIDENIYVRGDREKLEQVVQIFLDNARKYSKEGGRTLVRLKRVHSMHCRLSVSDEGEAIPAGELENIFKRFYRLDKARNSGESFGLGLSMAETIVKNYGGRIWAESNGGVNTFLVEFKTITSS